MSLFRVLGGIEILGTCMVRKEVLPGCGYFLWFSGGR